MQIGSKFTIGVHIITAIDYFKDITLYDIYKAVGSVDEAEGLFHFHEQPNPDCPVGRNIHKVLDQRLLDAQRAMEESLRSTTLADIAEDTRQAVNNE